MAVDEGDAWRLPVREFGGQTQPEMRAVEVQLLAADFIEEPRAIAQNDGQAGDRVPDHVAEAAQASERDADLIPVRVEGLVIRCSDGHQALRRCRDHP